MIYIYRYLSEIDLVAENFRQLVGGVIWLIRDGQSYVNESIHIECSDTEETGMIIKSLEFSSVIEKYKKVNIIMAKNMQGILLCACWLCNRK